MIIIGCDFHARFQCLAMLETETGEYTRRRLEHACGKAREFYAALPAPALVGIESSGYAQWFVEMLEELGHQAVVGDAAQIRARVVRPQKTDTRDAELRRDYKRLAFRHGWAKAQVAVARKLLIRLFILLRDGMDYAEFVRRGSHAGLPGLRLV